MAIARALLRTAAAAEFALVLLGCLGCVAAAIVLFKNDFVVLSIMVTTVTFWVLSLAVIKRLRAIFIDSVFALPAMLYLTTGLAIALRSEFVTLLVVLTIGPFFLFFTLIKKVIPRVE